MTCRGHTVLRLQLKWDSVPVVIKYHIFTLSPVTHFYKNGVGVIEWHSEADMTVQIKLFANLWWRSKGSITLSRYEQVMFKKITVSKQCNKIIGLFSVWNIVNGNWDVFFAQGTMINT